MWKKKNGKTGLAALGIIDSVLLRILQYRLSQILLTRWPVILGVFVCRHQNLPYKISSIIFTIPTVLLVTTFNIYNIVNLYHNVLICKHQDIISWFMCNRISCKVRSSSEVFTQIYDNLCLCTDC